MVFNSGGTVDLQMGLLIFRRYGCVSGGTIDITVHQIQPDNTLKELYKANGGNWGGTYVDKAFRDLLADIVGNDVMDSLAEGKTSDYFDLFRLVHGYSGHNFY